MPTRVPRLRAIAALLSQMPNTAFRLPAETPDSSAGATSSPKWVCRAIAEAAFTTAADSPSTRTTPALEDGSERPTVAEMVHR